MPIKIIVATWTEKQEQNQKGDQFLGRGYRITPPPPDYKIDNHDLPL